MGNFELISFANADELARAAANAWLDEIESANRAGTSYCVALSGGHIAQKFFATTAGLTKSRNVSFDHVHFFWADERCVPPNDPESNFKLANELLLAPLKISPAQIHRIRGEELPATAVKIAEAELYRTASYKNGPPVLDLIILGMGEDGHVASLFPGRTDGTGPKEIFCTVENSPKPPPRRVSLSYAAIAAARQVWVLVSGAGKEAAFRESLEPAGKTSLARVIRSRAAAKIFSEIKIF
ncbi:MAG TPA: 6-phosphogluconolactonase [Candidatus Aquilonibacter sp.]|nr:6-phosphogluconolactonase [Candidatus Aquilonibacter sp.]